MMHVNESKPTLLLVDDEPTNLLILRYSLQDEYRLLVAKEGAKAIEIAEKSQPDLILLDVMMPEMSGHEVCKILKANPDTKRIPILFITALTGPEDELLGFELGAVDYIYKPFNPNVVKARVSTQLSLVQVDELKSTHLKIIQCLGKAAEFKDDETGKHVIRMSHYAKLIAVGLGVSTQSADLLFHAAPMHDIGKIGIPDNILRKPGKLTEEEWEVMRQHTLYGELIIGGHDSKLLTLASKIALHHHEKWDGSGYPKGLSGSDIPLEARVVALADVFDALTTVRPYKEAWSVIDAVNWIKMQRGAHFDPDVVDSFLKVLPQIISIKDAMSD